MKKHSIKFCSVLLSALMLVSMLWIPAKISATATETTEINNCESDVFSVIEDENGIRFIGPTGDITLEADNTSDPSELIETVSDYYDAIGKKKFYSKSSILLKSSNSLPASVDNSKSEYFPEIGSQGGLGACTCWSQTYYQFTYMFNKSRGVTTTPENTFSPKWTYNLLNGGSGDNGTMVDDVYKLMMEIGNVTLSQVPYDDDPTTWSPYEEIWREAIRYRVKDYQRFSDIGEDDKQITSADDENLQAIKTALVNGDVLSFSTYISSWVSNKLKTNENAPENDKYADEYVVTSQSGASGGHRMTIVGYNDNIWTDINNNDTVDDGEMGAFKIANSWGKDYANKGFIWLSYDALNEVSCVEGTVEVEDKRAPISEIARMDVMPYNYNADLYLKYTLNSSYRGSVKPYLIAEKDGTEKSVYTLGKMTFGVLDGDKYSFDGTTESNDGTMIYPLSSLIPEINSENLSDYTFSVKFIDNKADGKILTVKDAQIVDESTNTVYKPENTYPIELDGDEATIELMKTTTNHSVVYYRGYEDIKMTYKIGDDEWKTVAMEENIEREGYVHKYVVDLMGYDEMTLYFSDDKGNVDDNNGSYYAAVKGLNYYATQNAREPVTSNILILNQEYLDVNSGVSFVAEASGGYQPYSYQFIFEDFVTGDISTDTYEKSNSSMYYPKSAGTHRIVVNVKDQSGAVVSKTMYLYVQNKPFAFKSFDISSSKNILVGQEIDFTAKTKYEGIKYYGYLANTYDVSIEKDGKVFNSQTISPDECDFPNKSCLINFSWTPTEAGNYTAKISSTDSNNEYSETQLSFDVAEFNGTIIGDANNNSAVDIVDATLIQKYRVNLVDASEIWLSLADSDKNNVVDIRDATYIQKYAVSLGNSAYVGNINYREPEPTTEPVTEPTTVEPTTEPTTEAEKNIVTFTNSHRWSGTIYCYYWSDSNKTMTAWPGKAMTNAGTNSYGETMYTFEVPDSATYVIFTNGSSQTVDIAYSGGEVRYYPTSETDSSGHYKVNTW